MSEQSKTNKASSKIGELLREAREAKGLSVSSAAMHTNLRKDIIEKLENNQFGDIGAPVFTRGYLNIYARFLEIDDTKISNALSADTISYGQQSLRIHSANAESQAKPYRRSVGRGWISLILVLLIGGTLIAQLLDEQSWLMQQIKGAFVTQEQDNSASTISSQAEPDNQDPDFTVEVDDNAQQLNIPTLTSIDDGTTTSTDNSSTDLVTPELTLSSLESSESDGNGIDGVNAAQSSSAVITSGSAVIKTSTENWIEIKDAKGKIVTSKIYSAGETIDLTASDAPYSLNIGRPNAIKLMVNGAEQPLEQFRSGSSTRLFKLSIANE